MGSAEETDPEPRPSRQSLAEIGSMALVTVPLGFLVLWAVSGSDWATLWENSRSAGAAVAAEIGWVIGAYVPTLLGFYVLITGEQLGRATNAGRLRRLLGAVAEASFATLIPALVLLVIHSLSDPAQLGLLFVVVPATGLVLFLTVQLGGFVVFETAVLLDDAQDSKARALRRVRALTARSRCRPWLVVLVNLVLAMVIGAVALTVAVGWGWLVHWEAGVFVLVAGLTVTLVGVFVAGLWATRTVLSSIVAASATVLAWILLGGLLWTIGSPVVSVAVAVMALLATISAWLPLQHSPRLLVNWSLAGALANIGSRIGVAQYRRSSRRALALSRQLQEREDDQLRSRLGEAWTVLRHR